MNIALANLSVPRSDPREVADLLWTNIGLRSGLDRRPRSLLLSAAAADDDKTQLCAHLAGLLAEQGKKVLLVDLERQGARFKQLLRYDANTGFTDLCYKLFDEPFFSRSVSEYGLTDLLALFCLKGRTGRLNLIGAQQAAAVTILLYKGFPVEVIGCGASLTRRIAAAAAAIRPEIALDPAFAQTPLSKWVASGTLSAGETRILYESQCALVLDEVYKRGGGFFEFSDLPEESYDDCAAFLPEFPPYLKGAPVATSFIAKQMENLSFPVPQGFRFMPHGQYPLKGGEIAVRYRKIMPILSASYDVVLVNAPTYRDHIVTRETAKLVDGTLLVVKSGAIDRKSFSKILRDMESDGVTLLGTVLSEVPPEHRSVI